MAKSLPIQAVNPARLTLPDLRRIARAPDLKLDP